MYLPPHFEETDSKRIRDLVEAYPLATLVAVSTDGLVVNHIPMIWRGNDEFVGHVALANELHRLVPSGADVVAVFQGADTYVSPKWYPSKQEHHRHVPTWNYCAVHVHGSLTFSHDVAAKGAAVAMLTRRHETLLHGTNGWQMGEAPKDYLQEMLDAIVAFKLKVERIEAKFKLSQNRDAKDYDGVVSALDAIGERAAADEMRRVRT
jgi:transcriptional regulator